MIGNLTKTARRVARFLLPVAAMFFGAATSLLAQSPEGAQNTQDAGGAQTRKLPRRPRKMLARIC